MNEISILPQFLSASLISGCWKAFAFFMLLLCPIASLKGFYGLKFSSGVGTCHLPMVLMVTSYTSYLYPFGQYSFALSDCSS